MKTKIVRTNKLEASNKLNLTANNQRKKQQIVEKISTFLKNKFSKIFKEKGYTPKHLLIDLNNLITDNDILNFDYNTVILRVEKSILEILSKLETKEVNSALLDMKKINELISKPNVNRNNKLSARESSDLQQTVQKQRNNLNKDITTSETEKKMRQTKSVDNLISTLEIKNKKLLDLKEKQNDEWALIAKHNFQKHLDVEKEKKMQAEQMKKIQKEILEKQMKEKEIWKLREKEDIEKFVRNQNENLKKLEEYEKNKINEQKEKVIRQKQMQEHIINITKKEKEELKNKDKNEAKVFLEKINHEMKYQDEDKVKKKENEREMYKRIIMENEKKVEQKKVEKEKEKEENKRALEEYSKLIEKQNQDRNNNLHNRKVKVYNNVSSDMNMKKREDLLKSYEEIKLMREIEEKEKR
jgi:hypothetical protein